MGEKLVFPGMVRSNGCYDVKYLIDLRNWLQKHEAGTRLRVTYEVAPFDDPPAPSLADSLRVVMRAVTSPYGVHIYPEHVNLGLSGPGETILTAEQAAEKLAELAEPNPVTREEAAEAFAKFTTTNSLAAAAIVRRFFAQKGA